MTKVTEAVYSQGVLKPVEDLGLREDQRVRLIVETVDDKAADRCSTRQTEGRNRENAVLLTGASALP
jgi:predicted DNA-binding antitoxin AbrB/MazE fold protein